VVLFLRVAFVIAGRPGNEQDIGAAVGAVVLYLVRPGDLYMDGTVFPVEGGQCQYFSYITSELLIGNDSGRLLQNP
jgi:hypothetical protein